MDQSNTSDIKNTDIWIYLPDTNTLSQYFNQKDLIELSKVCKDYRKQLKFKALRTLTIPCNFDKLDLTWSFDSANKSELIFNCLRSDLTGSHHLVKEVIFKQSFNSQFSKDFFSLFKNISSINVDAKIGLYSLESLVQILHNSKCLCHVSLKSKFHNFSHLREKKAYNFFHQLKTIKLYIHPHLIDKTLPFDIIDSSFSNLQSLTIINNRMLTKLSNGFPSLVFVEFLNEYCFENIQLSKFISNNPQLKKISISINQLNENVTNSILTLEKLDKLKIVDSLFFPVYNLYVSTENRSIKHLTFTGNGYIRYILKILEMCKSIQVFKIYDIELTKSLASVINETFQRIDTLLILNSLNCLDIVAFLLKLDKFKQVMFRNGCKFGDLYKYKHRWQLYWKSKNDYPRDADEFTLIRKSK